MIAAAATPALTRSALLKPLLLRLLAWSRMHRILSLEIDGFYDYVGVDPGPLYEAESQQLIEQRTREAGRARRRD